MKKSISQLTALFLIFIFLTGCAANTTPPSGENLDNPPPVEPAVDPTVDPPVEPLSERETAILLCQENMSLEEKVGQLFFVRCPAAGAVRDVMSFHLGGYLLFGRDFKDKTAETVTDEIASYQSSAELPLLIGVDEEGGTVVRISSNRNLWDHTFQSPQKLYGEGGLERIEEDTAEKCGMLAQYGVNVNFAPVADVSVSSGDFIYKRSLGQDAQSTAAYTARVAEVMAEHQIGAVLKHFPGYGNNVDTHTGIAVDQRSYESFVEQDFLPFQSAMGFSNAAVLVSHNIINCMDESLPASLSPEVHRVLREELGFEGVVLTDDLAMGAINAYAEDGSAAVLAILAGNDMVVTTDYPQQIPQVIAAVEDGTIPMEVIDAALGRVIGWKYDLGLIGEELIASWEDGK